MEISLRQQELYEHEAIPIIVLHSSIVGKEVREKGKVVGIIRVTVKNISKNPAFNISLTRILSRNYTPINPNVWTQVIQKSVIEDLEPGKEKELFLIDWYNLKKLVKKENAEIFEVSFMDKYGKFHSSLFVVYLKNGSLEVIPISGKEPRERGILLPMLNRICLLFSYYKYCRRLQNLKGGKNNGSRICRF